MDYRFWIRRLDVGRLSMSIVRNNMWHGTPTNDVKPRFGWLLNRQPGLGVFCTLRVGTLYVNADLLIG